MAAKFTQFVAQKAQLKGLQFASVAGEPVYTRCSLRTVHRRDAAAAAAAAAATAAAPAAVYQ